MSILCFGDSNTYGYDPRSFLGDRYPAEHRWVDLLAGKLGCTVINAGENGREIPRREREWVEFHSLLTRCSPIGLLIIMLGTNDLLQGYSAKDAAGRMEVFLERIDLEKSKILLIAPPPMKPGAWVQSQGLIDASKELDGAYQELADHLGVGFADAGQWGLPLTYDGVHLTEEGHIAFAEELYTRIDRH